MQGDTCQITSKYHYIPNWTCILLQGENKAYIKLFSKNKAKWTLLRQRTSKWSKWTQNDEKKKHINSKRKPSFIWNIYRSSIQRRRISNNRKAKKTKSNLDKGERDALKELSERTDVLTTNADKGGAVVIWETKEYINEAIDNWM